MDLLAAKIVLKDSAAKRLLYYKDLMKGEVPLDSKYSNNTSAMPSKDI